MAANSPDIVKLVQDVCTTCGYAYHADGQFERAVYGAILADRSARSGTAVETVQLQDAIETVVEEGRTIRFFSVIGPDGRPLRFQGDTRFVSVAAVGKLLDKLDTHAVAAQNDAHTANVCSISAKKE